MVGDTSIVGKVMTQPGDTDAIMVGLGLQIGDGSNFCVMQTMQAVDDIAITGS